MYRSVQELFHFTLIVCWQTITAGSEATAADAVSTVGVSTLKFINLLAQS